MLTDAARLTTTHRDRPLRHPAARRGPTLSPKAMSPNPPDAHLLRALPIVITSGRDRRRPHRRASRAALDAAGLPVPPKASRSRPRQAREHGDWQTNVALGLAKPVGAPPREIAQRIVDALDGVRRRAHVERVEIAGPGFVNFFLAPDVAARRAVAVGRQPATRTATATRTTACAINLEFVSANPTGPLHAGGGRWVAVGDAHREPARRAGRDGAPRVLPERRRQPARHVRARRCSRATHGTAAARGRLPGRSTSSRWPSAMRAELGDDGHRGAGARVGLRGRRRAGCRTTSAASACTSTPGSPSARCTSAATSPRCSTTSDGRRRHLRAGRRHLAAQPTDFGDQRDRVLVKSDGNTTYLLQRPRVPPRQVRARVGAPHRHLGRRPPRSGEVAAGRHAGARSRHRRGPSPR